MPWWKRWPESCSENSGRLGPKSEPSEIMTLSLPEMIEVKLAFVSEDTAKAFAILGLSNPPKEERRIHFFDTENLVLFDRGLILRVRQTVAGGDPDDATLKVRGPSAPDAASRFLATAGARAKFEGDQNVEREELPSFSITTKPDSEVVAAAVADPQRVESVFDEAGQTLFREIGAAEASPTEIKCLGPIRSRIWKLKPEGFAGKITAELWDVVGAQLLEISDKAPRAEASALAAQLKKLVPETKARQLDTSKTRFALQFIRAQSSTGK
jgi:hypothetical protein